MTSEECHQRASGCAVNAALATNELISQEFLKMAAQWRAMASKQIFIGRLDEPFDTLAATAALTIK